MDYSHIFSDNKVIAVIGMSKNPSKAAHAVPAYMRDNGFTIVPINPTCDEIDGMKCFAGPEDVEQNIDILLVFRPSEETDAIAEYAVWRKKEKGDIKVLWLQEGIFSRRGRELCDKAGIEYVENTCMYKVY